MFAADGNSAVTLRPYQVHQNGRNQGFLLARHGKRGWRKVKRCRLCLAAGMSPKNSSTHQTKNNLKLLKSSMKDNQQERGQFPRFHGLFQ